MIIERSLTSCSSHYVISILVHKISVLSYLTRGYGPINLLDYNFIVLAFAGNYRKGITIIFRFVKNLITSFHNSSIIGGIFILWSPQAKLLRGLDLRPPRDLWISIVVTCNNFVEPFSHGRRQRGGRGPYPSPGFSNMVQI